MRFKKSEIIYENDGLLGNVTEDSRSAVVPVMDVRKFFTDEVIVFLDPITGLREAGPVTVLTHDRYGERIRVSSPVSVSKGTAIYISGSQDEASPPTVTRKGK
jgi:hypothetical protein